MNAKEKALDHKELHHLLEYNQSTGEWTWKNPPGRKMKRGDIAGSIKWGLAAPTGYNVIRLKGEDYRSGRLAWFYVTGEWPVHTIDHIDRDSLNDAFDNLRDVPMSVQNENRKPYVLSGKYKGIKKKNKPKGFFQHKSFEAREAAEKARKSTAVIEGM